MAAPYFMAQLCAELQLSTFIITGLRFSSTSFTLLVFCCFHRFMSVYLPHSILLNSYHIAFHFIFCIFSWNKGSSTGMSRGSQRVSFSFSYLLPYLHFSLTISLAHSLALSLFAFASIISIVSFIFLIKHMNDYEELLF